MPLISAKGWAARSSSGLGLRVFGLDFEKISGSNQNQPDSIKDIYNIKNMSIAFSKIKLEHILKNGLALAEPDPIGLGSGSTFSARSG